MLATGTINKSLQEKKETQLSLIQPETITEGFIVDLYQEVTKLLSNNREGVGEIQSQLKNAILYFLELVNKEYNAENVRIGIFQSIAKLLSENKPKTENSNLSEKQRLLLGLCVLFELTFRVNISQKEGIQQSSEVLHNQIFNPTQYQRIKLGLDEQSGVWSNLFRAKS